jgi:hypothetical protein
MQPLAAPVLQHILRLLPRSPDARVMSSEQPSDSPDASTDSVTWDTVAVADALHT